VPTRYLLWENYSLGSLQSEIEIDNPRTDFRFGKTFVQTAQQIQAKHIPSPEELTNEQIVWVFDQLLIREMAWLDGWPLPYCLYDFA